MEVEEQGEHEPQHALLDGVDVLHHGVHHRHLDHEARVYVPTVEVVAAGGVGEEIAVAAVGREVSAHGTPAEAVVVGDVEVEVVLFAVEAVAYGFGLLPGVALPLGAVDVVATLTPFAVAAEVEHPVALVVEGRQLVGSGVDHRPQVDALAALAVLDDGVPDVVAAQASRTVADEVEDDRAVLQAAHGGLRRGVPFHVHRPFEPDGLLPATAFLLLGEVYLAVEGLHVATGEVEVLAEGVEGYVARVVAAAVETPAVELGARHLAALGYAGLVDLHHAAAHVEVAVGLHFGRHRRVDHHRVAHAQGAGLAAGGVERFLQVHHAVLAPGRI